ncbi:TNF receptor-associated factor 4-like [Oopsacas minuta]|uniref:TNF receptor-associated factor 4-like n=1 Tax=Oopsacas minuta TaxID=111878 RepID=A0AAV7KHJ7_9METZ|nr:TNF receptor-associated factor 4-like [Oopsacas minuta]
MATKQTPPPPMTPKPKYKLLLSPEIGRNLCRVKDSEVNSTQDMLTWTQSYHDSKITGVSRNGSNTLNRPGIQGYGEEYRGYRRDILIEDLSDRMNVFLVCNRCKGIMRDACMSTDGEQFCECCRKQESLYSEQYEQTIPNAHVRNTVLSLKCSCPLFERGCKWLGILEKCENHLDLCSHVYEKCKLGCGIVLQRHKLKRHVCEKRKFRETPCQTDFKVSDMPQEECPKMALTCELGCGMLICWEDMARHLKEECEVGLIKRKELNQHLEGKRTEHTDLKLSAMEDNVMQKSELIVKQNEMIEQMSQQFISLCSITNTSNFEWRIENVQGIVSGDLPPCSQQFQVAGFDFNLNFVNNAMINIHFPNQEIRKLDWPFKAKFNIRLICHTDLDATLQYESRIIEIKQKECIKFGYYSAAVIQIDAEYATDEHFIRDGGIDFEIFVI